MYTMIFRYRFWVHDRNRTRKNYMRQLTFKVASSKCESSHMKRVCIHMCVVATVFDVLLFLLDGLIIVGAIGFALLQIRCTGSLLTSTAFIQSPVLLGAIPFARPCNCISLLCKCEKDCVKFDWELEQRFSNLFTHAFRFELAEHWPTCYTWFILQHAHTTHTATTKVMHIS